MNPIDPRRRLILYVPPVEPPEPPSPHSMRDVPCGQLWLCIAPEDNSFCAAIKNQWDEIVRVNPESPNSWFTSSYKPHHFELIRPIAPLAVDFSQVRDLR